MPLYIVENDITKMKVDAIVNAANESLLGGGGVDGAIHRAAGPELLVYCRKLNGCPTGQAKITPGFNLPAKYVIHTVGPIYQNGRHGEENLLRSCYEKSLQLAVEKGLTSIAFPLISAGIYGYPKAEAFHVAKSTILRFLEIHDLEAYLVIYNRQELPLDPEIQEKIDAHLSKYEQVKLIEHSRNQPKVNVLRKAPMMKEQMASAPAFKDLDESFSEMLLRKIDEAGLTDPQCYKRANIDRKLFSKIRKDPHYQPKKATALAFAIALELSLKETQELLRKAGFALSPSHRFDVIVEYFLKERKYDIHEINQVLFHYDQPLLGA